MKDVIRLFIVVTVGVIAASGFWFARPAASSKVTYIPAAQVTAAFSKGAVLVNNGSYQVHASRREVPGQVEVHVKDTDVIYMLEGSTTFVTGGDDGRRQDDRCGRNSRVERKRRGDSSPHKG